MSRRCTAEQWEYLVHAPWNVAFRPTYPAPPPKARSVASRIVSEEVRIEETSKRTVRKALLPGDERDAELRPLGYS